MKIYNSLSRKKEEFVPIKKGHVGMYVCGPTVYDQPHIGHARSAYIFDIVRRYLGYKDVEVTFVRNVTDVDDKIIEKAKSAVSSGLCAVSLKDSVKEVSKKYLDAYHEDMDLIGIGRPDKEPKATQYIPKMIKFIELLIKNGFAYEAGGDVYFDIKKTNKYGKLSNQNPEKMEIGARIAPGEKKKDPLDFALWKMAKTGEPSWESPWGNGRPGWHIECSVMSTDILGGEFDIHGGGIDLIFPHHENEIAQSEGAGKKFARYWMHNGLLTINGEKMAKSAGNFISMKDFMEQHKDSDYLKLLFLNTHYRHPVDYSEEKISEMKSQKERFIILLDKIGRMLKDHRPKTIDQRPISEFREKFEEAMDDDFNTPLALAAMFDLVSFTNRIMQDRVEFTQQEIGLFSAAGQALKDLGAVFGLDFSKSAGALDVDKKEIAQLIKKRNELRNNGDFKAADKIRGKLYEEDIILEDTKNGTIWRKKA